MTRSAAKSGQSGPRYRAYQEGKLKGLPIVRRSARGNWRTILRAATAERIRREQERARQWNRSRMEEGSALMFFRDLPSVEDLAWALKRRAEA